MTPEEEKAREVRYKIMAHQKDYLVNNKAITDQYYYEIDDLIAQGLREWGEGMVHAEDVLRGMAEGEDLAFARIEAVVGIGEFDSNQNRKAILYIHPDGKYQLLIYKGFEAGEEIFNSYMAHALKEAVEKAERGEG